MADASLSKPMVIGHRGMLGSDLVAKLAARGMTFSESPEGDGAAVAFDLPEFDATDEDAVIAAARGARPSVVINCAGYTDVDGCEDDEQRAHAVNGFVPGALARAAGSVGALMVHVSTDFVFDGDTDEPYREDDPVNPLSVYGKSKLAGEAAVLESGCDYLICRTAWLYGANGKNFVTTILRLAGERPVLRVVADQFGSPTWTADLADMIITLVDKNARGIIHTVNAGRASWADLARETIRSAGLSAKVEDIGAAEYPRKAPLPVRSSVLSTDKYRLLAARAPRHWKRALSDFLNELSG